MTSPVYSYKKLNYLYNVQDTFTCGIKLEGWEAKALQEHLGKIDISYCIFKNNSFYLVNAIIKPLSIHNIDNINESRDRILLLNKNELIKIKSQLMLKGYTCIPTKLYRNNKNLWKLDIAIVTGKKLYDHREQLKARDLDREMKKES